MALTSKELTALEDQLGMEKLLISKCKMYAQMCQDPALKQKCETIAGKHMAHYDSLCQLLQ